MLGRGARAYGQGRAALLELRTWRKDGLFMAAQTAVHTSCAGFSLRRSSAGRHHTLGARCGAADQLPHNHSSDIELRSLPLRLVGRHLQARFL